MVTFMTAPHIRRMILLFSLLGCVASSARVYCGESSRDTTPTDPLLAQIEQGDPVDLSGFNRLEARQRRTIAVLMRRLRTEPHSVQASRCMARSIELLGLYRAPEAARDLAQRFDFVEQGWRAEEDPLNPYPAARAIIRIGRPAIDQLIRACSTWDSEHQFHLAAWILKEYYHDEEDVGLYRLNRALRQAENSRDTNEKLTRNLKRLIAKYQWVELDNIEHAPRPPKKIAGK